MLTKYRTEVLAVTLLALGVLAAVLLLRRDDPPPPTTAPASAADRDGMRRSPRVRPTDPAVRKADLEHDMEELNARLTPPPPGPNSLPDRVDDTPEGQEASDRITAWESQGNQLWSVHQKGRMTEAIGRELTADEAEAVKAEIDDWQDNFIRTMVAWRKSEISTTEWADQMDVVSVRVFENIRSGAHLTEEDWDKIQRLPPPPVPTRPQLSR